MRARGKGARGRGSAGSKSAVADFDISKCQSRASPTLVPPALRLREKERSGGTPALHGRQYRLFTCDIAATAINHLCEAPLFGGLTNCATTRTPLASGQSNWGANISNSTRRRAASLAAGLVCFLVLLLPQPVTAQSRWTPVATGDFNGDGTADILLRDNSGRVNRSAGGNQLSRSAIGDTRQRFSNQYKNISFGS